MTAARTQAIEKAAQTLVAGRAFMATLSVEEAARRAFTPTGPPLEELERRIRHRRESERYSLAEAS